MNLNKIMDYDSPSSTTGIFGNAGGVGDGMDYGGGGYGNAGFDNNNNNNGNGGYSNGRINSSGRGGGNNGDDASMAALQHAASNMSIDPKNWLNDGNKIELLTAIRSLALGNARLIYGQEKFKSYDLNVAYSEADNCFAALLTCNLNDVTMILRNHAAGDPLEAVKGVAWGLQKDLGTVISKYEIGAHLRGQQGYTCSRTGAFEFDNPYPNNNNSAKLCTSTFQSSPIPSTALDDTKTLNPKGGRKPVVLGGGGGNSNNNAGFDAGLAPPRGPAALSSATGRASRDRVGKREWKNSDERMEAVVVRNEDEIVLEY